ncbi:MAG TPA: hypothetical protein VMV49_07025 [Candidatus Deferrimicrobium sp.]|nr:hypothetical protein [Candidatus Deferrimicrobium sp.]
MFEQDDSVLILKYYPPGETINKMANLRLIKDPNQKELLVLTSSSLAKFTKYKNSETIHKLYLRHITGTKIELAHASTGLLVAAIILLSIGGVFSFFFFTPYMFILGLLIGLPCLGVGIGLLISYLVGRPGIIQIYSYDSESPFVDGRFTRTQIESVLDLVKEMHELIKLRSST